MEIRNQYDRVRVTAAEDPGQGRTKQSFKDECDINNVVALHNRTGSLSHVNQGTPTYGDYANVVDYQQALNITISANGAFMDLPSALRKRFNNNPMELLEFLDDPANLEEGQKLGLFETPAVEIDGQVVVPAKNSPSPDSQETEDLSPEET